MKVEDCQCPEPPYEQTSCTLSDVCEEKRDSYTHRHRRGELRAWQCTVYITENSIVLFNWLVISLSIAIETNIG